MKIIQFLTILLLSIKAFGQTKPILFYNETGKEVTKKKFLELKDSRKNLDIYFEDDSLLRAKLITRKKFGQLDQKSFERLKTYLTDLSLDKIDSTENIVINYLSGFSKKPKNDESRSNWNVLHKNYLKKLHKIANVNQFWINSPKTENLEYFYSERINWITDKEDIIKELFFPYDGKFGNYILIKSDGKFYSYIGEHSKYEILENSTKFFR